MPCAVQEMEELAASFNAEAEIAYSGAVDNNKAAQALLSCAGALKKSTNSPNDGQLQGWIQQFAF